MSFYGLLLAECGDDAQRLIEQVEGGEDVGDTISAESSVSMAAPSCDMTQMPRAASFNMAASLAP